jgi:hypothetical protein
MNDSCPSCGRRDRVKTCCIGAPARMRKPLMPRIIRCTQWTKPIPLRQFDWIATAEDYEPGDPIGSGSTEEAALCDLAEQYLEKENPS